MINALNAIPSRQIDALKSVIISIGLIHGGTSNIVLQETVELRGSVWTLKAHVRDSVKDLFKRAVTMTCEAQGGNAEIEYTRAYPPTVNTAEETTGVADVSAAVPGIDEVQRGDWRRTATSCFGRSRYCNANETLLLRNCPTLRTAGMPARPRQECGRTVDEDSGRKPPSQKTTAEHPTV